VRDSEKNIVFLVLLSTAVGWSLMVGEVNVYW